MTLANCVNLDQMLQNACWIRSYTALNTEISVKMVPVLKKNKKNGRPSNTIGLLNKFEVDKSTEHKWLNRGLSARL